MGQRRGVFRVVPPDEVHADIVPCRSLDKKEIDESQSTRTKIEDLSFQVGSGESFVVLGGSGSGKSVLLRQLNGLEAPDRGREGDH